MPFPALFVSHGAPSAALEDDAYTRALGAWARGRPRPRAIVVVSAHGEAQGPPRVSSAAHPDLIFDFYGFPPPLYQLEYPAPGAPDLSREIAKALDAAGAEPVLDGVRGWDHGVWVPLLLLYPDADVPVIQLSLPVPRSPSSMLAMGAALAPFRDRGVLLLGTGGVVHNLRRLGDGSGALPWAAAFDDWVAARLETLDVEALQSYATAAPHADLAVPTTEHLDPIFFVLGSRGPRDRAVGVYEGFRYGSLSLRSFALATP